MGHVLMQKEELEALCMKKLLEAGVPREDAGILTDSLIHANLRGVDSHGVMRLEHYLKRMRLGSINIHPSFSVKETGPVTAVFDGDDGLGHVVATRAMEKAVEMAQSKGVGMVAVKNSSHCGALSYIVLQAVQKGLIGIAMANTDKAVVPYGGSRPFFGTNPLAFGFPAGKSNPVILDMATSAVAFGKILSAREKEEPLPADCAVDSSGQFVRDPSLYAALVHFGGPKGVGLAMVVDIFAGILTGSAFGPHVSLMYGDYEKKRKLGHFLCAVNISAFSDKEEFLSQMDRMISELHEVAPAKGHEGVMVPGEPESKTEEERRKYGIPVPLATATFLTGAGNGR